MTAYVFAGPTLSRAEVGELCDAVCLPPAAQGDIFRAAQSRPRVIGIIDGYFEGAPSIWHKEILWAMSQGIHVLGSASMGALRAAELAEFGMLGIGEIFQSYRDGRLQDDDEVAVVHGPAETGYLALSEAMVNIRATLQRAEHEAVVVPATHTVLSRLAKELFYKNRTWDALLDRAAADQVSNAELDVLRRWLPDGRVDVKHADARAMLAAMRDLLATGPTPKRTDYTFEWTEMWESATAFSPSIVLDPTDDSGALERTRVLDELRLEGDAFQRARQDAFIRLLALRESDRRGVQAVDGALNKHIKRFRREHGLFQRKDLDRWLAANGISLESFEHLMECETRLNTLESLVEESLDHHLFDALRLSGRYASLAERARDKQQVLASRGLEDPEPGRVGPAPARLLAWFFEGRLGQPIPDDIEDCARRLGFAGKREFYRELLREFLYLSCTGESAAARVPGPDS
jgi:hypothetical protein